MLRLLAATACALALTAAAPVVAHADSRILVDGTGDMWQEFDVSKPEPQRPTRAPERRRADILSAAVAHKAHQVVIRVKVAELTRSGGNFLVVSRLRTDAGMGRGLRLAAGPGKTTWRGRIEFLRNGFTEPVDCATTHQIDYARDRAVIRVPRSCLATPNWVKAAVGTGTVTTQRVFTDNAHNHRPAGPLRAFTRAIRRS